MVAVEVLRSMCIVFPNPELEIVASSTLCASYVFVKVLTVNLGWHGSLYPSEPGHEATESGNNETVC